MKKTPTFKTGDRVYAQVPGGVPESGTYLGIEKNGFLNIKIDGSYCRCLFGPLATITPIESTATTPI